MADDESKANGHEAVDVTLSPGMPDELTNTAPAIESGPHLDDPKLRAAKRAQLKAAGVRLSDPGLTDEMKAILREKE